MKKTQNAKMTEEETIWPPAPTNSAKNMKPALSRPYLTYKGWADTVVGVIAGLGFSWFFSYGITNYILYPLLRHHSLKLFGQENYFWNEMVSCGVTFLASLLLWSQLRLFYRRLANTMLWASILLCVALMYFFY